MKGKVERMTELADVMMEILNEDGGSDSDETFESEESDFELEDIQECEVTEVEG